MMYQFIMWATINHFIFSSPNLQVLFAYVWPNFPKYNWFYGVIFRCFKKRFSFSLDVFLWLPCPDYLVCNFVSLSVEISIYRSSYFVFLFFVGFFFLSVLMIPIMQLASLLSFSLKVYRIHQVLVLMRLLQSLLLANFLLAYFFIDIVGLCHLLCHLDHLSEFHSCSFGKLSGVPYKRNCLGVYSFDDIFFYHRAWFRKVFLLFWGTLFLFFYNFSLLNGVYYQYSQVVIDFLLAKRSNSFHI